MEVSPLQLLPGNRTVKVWYSGDVDRLRGHVGFLRMCGVKSKNDSIPLEKFADAYDRMMSGKVWFPAVLKMGMSS